MIYFYRLRRLEKLLNKQNSYGAIFISKVCENAIFLGG
jgi:hypothetical protein